MKVVAKIVPEEDFSLEYSEFNFLFDYIAFFLFFGKLIIIEYSHVLLVINFIILLKINFAIIVLILFMISKKINFYIIFKF